MLVHGERLCPSCNVFKPHWHEIPDVYTGVHAVARTGPVVVDVAKYLERIPACVVPCNHRIMAKGVRLVFGAIPDLGEVRDAVPWQRQGWLLVMVSDYEMFAGAWKLAKQHIQVNRFF